MKVQTSKQNLYGGPNITSSVSSAEIVMTNNQQSLGITGLTDPISITIPNVNDTSTNKVNNFIFYKLKN